MAKDTTRVRRKERKNIANAVAHVNSSFNNTMITIADPQGNAISWSSSGMMGFKGSRKSTPYAAQVAAEDAGRKAAEHGVRNREAKSPFLAKVIKRSKTGRNSFALGKVVTICSCFTKLAAMLANMAVRCSCVRFSFRCP